MTTYALPDEVRARFRAVFTACGASQSKCKLCHRDIWWLPNHKSPFSDDGVSHFADCPNAGQFRKAARP